MKLLPGRLCPAAAVQTASSACVPRAAQLPHALDPHKQVPPAQAYGSRVRPELPAPGNKQALHRRRARVVNVLHASEVRWGARSYIVRLQLLQRSGVAKLLRSLTPRHMAYIRSNVFVPAALSAWHARLHTGSQGLRATALPEPQVDLALVAGSANDGLTLRPRTAAAPTEPLARALAALLHGGRLDKLTYLFGYFHLLAGSDLNGGSGGAWCGVADARDARLMGRLAAALHDAAEPAHGLPQELLAAPATSVPAHTTAAPLLPVGQLVRRLVMPFVAPPDAA